MIFASTDPATQEWTVNQHIESLRVSFDGKPAALVIRPARAHKPNRFLLAYRENVEHYDATPPEWLDYMSDYLGAKDDEYWHARRVLTRWIGVFG